MLISRGIRCRLINYIDKKANGLNMSTYDFAEKMLGVTSSSMRMIESGEANPSLDLCEKVIRDGCDPHYLFFGEFNKGGDPVKCFAKTRGGGCKSLTDDQCPGYNNCPFYKSEARYIFETMGCKAVGRGLV